jgi:3',5'-cyclic-AMP phosphodiesterase
VALTGDLIQDDSREAYGHIDRLLGVLGLPVRCVPGNHDIRPLMREVLDHEPFHYCGAAELRNWLVAGVDSCIEGSPGGRVAAAELDWLDEVIGASAAEHALVCVHHPPLPIGSRWLDELGMENGDEFLRRLARTGKVRMAVFGHAHQAFEGRHGEVQVVGTPSTCRQFRIGSDSFEVDDNPPAYRRITLQPEGTVDTELVWVPLAPHAVL